MSEKQLINQLVTLWLPGNFDIIHPGHMELFHKCSKRFPRVKLVIGLKNDN